MEKSIHYQLSLCVLKEKTQSNLYKDVSLHIIIRILFITILHLQYICETKQNIYYALSSASHIGLSVIFETVECNNFFTIRNLEM